MTKYLAYLLLLVAIGAGVLVWDGKRIDAAELRGATAQKDADQKAADEQKAEAAKLLADETTRADAVTAAYVQFKDQQEIKDVKAARITAGYKAQLAAAAGTVGRLRDPNAAPCGRGQSGDSTQAQAVGGAVSGSDNGAEAGGLLSKELTGLLQGLLSEADQINTAYASCRADLFNRINSGTIVP